MRDYLYYGFIAVTMFVFLAAVEVVFKVLYLWDRLTKPR